MQTPMSPVPILHELLRFRLRNDRAIIGLGFHPMALITCMGDDVHSSTDKSLN